MILLAASNRKLYLSDIPTETIEDVISRESIVPRLYGIPKIHKLYIPPRLIVSTIGSPIYNSAKYLTWLLKLLTDSTPSYVISSIHFVHQISDITLDPDDCLVSFDIFEIRCHTSEPSSIINIPILNSPFFHS